MKTKLMYVAKSLRASLKTHFSILSFRSRLWRERNLFDNHYFRYLTKLIPIKEGFDMTSRTKFLEMPLRKFLYFIILISITSCEKQTTWQLNENTNTPLVVEGIITDEYKSQTITLSFPVTELNTIPQAASGALVIISNEDSTYFFTETPANSGIYKSNFSFAAMLNKNYTLIINYNNTIYSAKAKMTTGSFFHPLQYVKNSNNELYHIIRLPNTYAPIKYSMWEILLDWSKVLAFQNQNPDSCKARILSYSLPTIDVSQVYSPEIEKVFFPLGTTITQKRYSLTPEHAEFIRALLCETNWQGGLFDSAHSNLPTNISNGAVGFFAVCAVNSVSFKVTP